MGQRFYLKKRIVLLSLLLGFVSHADDFRLSSLCESNNAFRMDFGSQTSSYYLVRWADALTNTAWGLTGMVLGVEGTQFWRDPALQNIDLRYYRVSFKAQTNSGDADADGLKDVYELHNAPLNPLNAADASQDFDGDGLNNLEEYQRGTNPNSSDTDEDGFSDGDESTNRTDPCNPDISPPTISIQAPANNVKEIWLP